MADRFRKKPFQGVVDAAQRIHSAHLNKKCAACSHKAMTQFTTFMPQSDLHTSQAAVHAKALLHQYPDGKIPTIRLKDGLYIKVGTAYACLSCTPMLERELAKVVPSYWIVDRDYGPVADTATVAVAR